MPGWRPEDVRDLVSARSGGGGVWECSGTLIALGNGRELAHVEGIEEVLLEKRFQNTTDAESKQSVIHLTSSTGGRLRAPNALTHAATLLVRSSLFYTGLVAPHKKMNEFRYRPTTPARRVDAILSPPARVVVARDDAGGLVLTRKRAGHPDVATVIDTAPRRVRRQLAAAWTYVGRRAAQKNTGLTTPAVVERCDYTVTKEGGTWAWTRVGRCPAWYGRGQCVTYLSARRLDGGWRDVDDRVKEWMRVEGRTGPFCQDDVEAAAVTNLVESAEKKTRRKFLGLF
ncbi:unnamed protein product [Chondrus crispus]|uniref:Uncharacterized protein n=1 Tax=Chondrus crispus TaxID=2769 RepID=R7QG85_CHOCR|nr:unnamed protein product [Chondrus crispus]CDF37517.1 unnamed protein product [Chondrus crispus]|eukprot:XP_005717388.1 unnamed protein product [Chondrus crispus]